MSKTHIAVGVASALAIAQTGSAESCVAAMIGGSIGGIIADCDITPSRAHKDALIGRIIVIAVSVASLAIDYWYGAGVCDYLVGSLGSVSNVGVTTRFGRRGLQPARANRAITRNRSPIWLQPRHLMPPFRSSQRCPTGPTLLSWPHARQPSPRMWAWGPACAARAPRTPPRSTIP